MFELSHSEDGMLLCSFVWVQYQLVTDEQIDGLALGNTRLALCAVARKNRGTECEWRAPKARESRRRRRTGSGVGVLAGVYPPQQTRGLDSVLSSPILVYFKGHKTLLRLYADARQCFMPHLREGRGLGVIALAPM